MAIQYTFNQFTSNIDTLSLITINGTANGLSVDANQVLSLALASTSTIGALSDTDWNTFNGKQNALGFTPENAANKGVANGYASLDASALIPITQIPPAALERLIVVADQTARYALTTATAQNGDTVQQTDTGAMYFIIDDTNLNNASGYAIYTVGTASSVPWSGITGIPAPVSSLSGTNTGDITLGTANGLSLLGQALSLGLASTSTIGALSDTDWNTFNGKVNSNLGNLTSPTAINQHLLPASDFGFNLGSQSLKFNIGYVAEFRDGNNFLALSNISRILYDSSGLASIDWNNQILATSGTTKLDWSGTDVSLNTRKLTDVVDPTAATDVATKYYVDNNHIAPVNYVVNGAFDIGTSGWVISKNTSANAIPDNGFVTSGTTNTITRSTSAPLEGVASGLYTLGALGNQVSYAFTINAADQGRVLQGAFDYAIASGTYADDTVTVWIYDVTNDVFIQPAPYLVKNQSLPSDTMPFEFQTAINSVSYKLVLQQAAASTAVIKLDNVVVGRQAKLYGSAITDWQSYSLTIGAQTTAPTLGTTTTNSAKWRRVGDSMEIVYSLVQTGAGSAGSGYYKFPLPSGFSADSSKILVGNNNVVNIGSAAVYNGSLVSAGVVQLLDSTNLVITVGADTLATTQVGSSFYQLSGANIQYGFSAKVPILGWSSSQIMSQDASTRVVGMRASAVPTGTLAVSFNDVVIGTIKSDTHSSYNTSTGVYTIKVPGYYNISASTRVNSSGSSGAGTAVILRVVQNSTAIARKTEVVQATWSSATLSPGVDVKNVWCNAGDTLKLDIYASLATTLSYDATAEDHWFSVEMSQGPAQIMASSLIACQYNTTGGVTSWGATTVIPYTAKQFDTTNSYNTSTGLFTCPSPGIYSVTSQFFGAGSFSYTYLGKNGSSVLSRMVQIATSGQPATILVECLQGDTLGIYNASASTTSVDGAAFNSVSFHRISGLN